MKILTFTTIFFLLSFYAIAQEVNSRYDSTLARSFGADEYGMKGYVLVILKTGSNTMEKNAQRDSLFAGHLKNISELANAGKLVIAGPLGQNENSYRGIFILNVNSFEEANEILQTDPTIKEKILEAELYQWYGAAALSEYIKTQEKITKYKF